MSSSTDRWKDAEERYKDAQQRAEQIKAHWQDLGEPVTATGSTGQLVAHPLLKAIQDAERHALLCQEPLLKKHAGPEPSAVLKPSSKPRITRRG